MKRNQTTSLMLLLAAAAGLAAAGPEEGDKQDKSLLKGPQVRQTAPRQSNPALTDATEPAMNDMTSKPSKATPDDQGGQNKDADADHPKAPTLEQQPAMFREYVMAIRGLNDRQVDPAAALTDAQRRDLREIMMTNRTEIRQFQTDNREKLRALRQAAGLGADQRARSDAAQPGDPGLSPEQAAKGREALRHFLETAPPNIEALAKIKRLLTDDQNKLVSEQIMVMRQRNLDKANEPQGRDAKRRDRSGDNPDADRGPRVINRSMNRDTARRGPAKRQQGDKADDKPQPPSDD